MENLRKFHASAQPGRCYSLAEIARGVGVSGESVRKWQEAALMKLRKRLSSYEFKEMGIDLKEFIKLK